jgi:hypothetical protein
MPHLQFWNCPDGLFDMQFREHWLRSKLERSDASMNMDPRAVHNDPILHRDPVVDEIDETGTGHAASSMMAIILAVVAVVVVVAVVAAWSPWSHGSGNVTPGQGGGDQPRQEQRLPTEQPRLPR